VVTRPEHQEQLDASLFLPSLATSHEWPYLLTFTDLNFVSLICSGVCIPPAPTDTALPIRSETNSESLMDLRETLQEPSRVLRKLFVYKESPYETDRYCTPAPQKPVAFVFSSSNPTHFRAILNFVQTRQVLTNPLGEVHVQPTRLRALAFACLV
jgi:hypothetical protein